MLRLRVKLPIIFLTQNTLDGVLCRLIVETFSNELCSDIST